MRNLYLLVTVKREPTMKFLRILLDENLNWKIIQKNIGILYRSRFLLNEECTKQLYFSFIHGNAAWESGTKTNLKILLHRQKNASRTIF